VSSVNPERGGHVGVHARFSPTVRWRVAVTGSNGTLVRAWSGVGSEAAVRWNGRNAAGRPAPAGWATVTVTAAAGGATARPVHSQVFVDRAPPPSGTSTGGFAAGTWTVSNANADQRSTSSAAFVRYRFGRAGDIPVVGDWDGDGDWTPGTVRAGAWSLRNANSGGGAQLRFRFGRSGDRYLVGDWDGDGDFTPAVRRGDTFWFRNAATTGPAQFSLRFGGPTDLGFVGDWNGNGTWTPGVLRAGAKWYLKDSFTGSTARVGLRKQTPGTPVVGDWTTAPDDRIVRIASHRWL
jgi:hypothetical protein